MTQADLKAAPRTRWTVVVLVTLMHVGLVAGLIRAFTPDFAATAADVVIRAFTIPAPPPQRPAPAPSEKVAAARTEGAAGAAGRRAKPREIAASPVKIAIKPTQAPPVQGRGEENASGVRDVGAGTGASGAGHGTGAGTGGIGQGGGGTGSPTVKIEGDINSARDYPRASRDLRIGASVTIELAVGSDGQVKGCRIVQPSPDPDADRITCALATSRFRFRPARDALGNPVRAMYRWRQRWFY